jgi:hypothetical protein
MSRNYSRGGGSSGDAVVGEELAAGHLAAVFARMSGLLLSPEKMDTALRMIAALAVEMVPGTTGAGMSLLDREGERVTAAQQTRWSSKLTRCSTSSASVRA